MLLTSPLLFSYRLSSSSSESVPSLYVPAFKWTFWRLKSFFLFPYHIFFIASYFCFMNTHLLPLVVVASNFCILSVITRSRVTWRGTRGSYHTTLGCSSEIRLPGSMVACALRPETLLFCGSKVLAAHPGVVSPGQWDSSISLSFFFPSFVSFSSFLSLINPHQTW